MVTWNWVNIGSGNGLLPDAPRHYRNQYWLIIVEVQLQSPWGQFHKRCLNHQLLTLDWKITYLKFYVWNIYIYDITMTLHWIWLDLRVLENIGWFNHWKFWILDYCGAIDRKDYVIFYDKTQTLVALKFLWSLIQMMAYLFGFKPSPEPM